jgi:hypothetical protein
MRTRRPKDLTPRRTQYKGIVFRSKSEAVFARSLDLVGMPWRYEPFNGLDNPPGKHQWDFLVFTNILTLPVATCGDYSYVLHGHKQVLYEPWFVELKPQAPNEFYLNDLRGRLLSCKQKGYPGNFGVISGNPWNATAYSYSILLHQRVPSDEACRELAYIAEQAAAFSGEAMNYRYDLCVQDFDHLISLYINNNARII